MHLVLTRSQHLLAVTTFPFFSFSFFALAITALYVSRDHVSRDVYTIHLKIQVQKMHHMYASQDAYASRDTYAIHRDAFISINIHTLSYVS